MERDVVSFYGLGSFYLDFNGAVVDGSDWVSRRALYLLMYLAVQRDKTANSEELIEVFWPESDPEDAKSKLYNTVYLLRKSLEKDGLPKDFIESVSGGYEINSSYETWSDWSYFEENVKNLLLDGNDEICVLEVENLFLLYRGDFFPALKYEGWTEVYREKLREYYLNLIEILTEKLYEKQRYRDTVNYLHKGIEYDPYRENFYLLYIKALVKLGRIAEAINSYKKCEKILKDELNVLPGQELKEEYHRIKLSRDISGRIKESMDDNLLIKEGAMRCDLDVFRKVYELELRQVKRINKSFTLITINFEDVKLNVSFEEIVNKISKSLRLGDVVSNVNKKIHVILHNMSLVDSGIIMRRFYELCDELQLDKKPEIEIKEIK